MNQNSEYYESIGLEEKLKWEARLGGWFRKAQENVNSQRILDTEVCHYLTCRDGGQQILYDLCLERTQRLEAELAKPHDILLVMHPDGWVAVYGHKRVRPCFYTKSQFDASPEQRKLSETLLDVQLPEKLKPLHFPHATEDAPGQLGACQAIVVNVQLGDGESSVFTWEACENPWPNIIRSAVPLGRSTQQRGTKKLTEPTSPLPRRVHRRYKRFVRGVPPYAVHGVRRRSTVADAAYTNGCQWNQRKSLYPR